MTLTLDKIWEELFAHFQLDTRKDVHILFDKELQAFWRQLGGGQGHNFIGGLWNRITSKAPPPPSILAVNGYTVISVHWDCLALVRGLDMPPLEVAKDSTLVHTPYLPSSFWVQGKAAEVGVLEKHFGQGVLDHSLPLYHSPPPHPGVEADVHGVVLTIDCKFASAGAWRTETGTAILFALKDALGDCLTHELFTAFHRLRLTYPHPPSHTISCIATSGDGLTFHVWDMAFDPPERLQPPRIVKTTTYRVVHDSRPLPAISGVIERGLALAASRRTKRPGPRSNSPEAVGDLVTVIARGWNTREHFGIERGKYRLLFDSHLSDARSLGLISPRTREPFELTDLGREFVALDTLKRGFLLAELAFAFPTLAVAGQELQSRGEFRDPWDDNLRKMCRARDLWPSAHTFYNTWAWLSWIGGCVNGLSIDGKSERRCAVLNSRPQPSASGSE